MQWFRWYHGTTADLKFGRIARESSQSRERALFVWAMILERASDSDVRGKADLVAEDVADILHCKTESVMAIVEAMLRHGMIEENHGVITVCKWAEHQPARDDSAGRQRTKRKRDAGVTPTARDSNAHVTPPDSESESESESPPIVPPKGESRSKTSLPSDWQKRFDDFKQIYPSRGKATNPVKPAREKFAKLIRDGTDPQAIIAGAKGYAKAMTELGYAGTDRVKQMVTFLNQAVWDQYQTAQGPPNGANGSDPPRIWEQAHKSAAYEGQFPGCERHQAVADEIMGLVRAGDHAGADKVGKDYLDREAACG